MYGSATGNEEAQNYNQSWDTGLRYNSGIYSSQLIANYQRLKNYNYTNNLGRYAGDATLDDMEQRYIQWGNSIEVGHGAISGGIDWKQEKLTSSSITKSDDYERDTTGLYLTGQQQISNVTLEASGKKIMMNSLAGMVPGRQLLAGSLLMATRQHFLTVPVFFRLLLDSNTGLLALLQFMVLVLQPTQI